jgi:hypothetical protein
METWSLLYFCSYSYEKLPSGKELKWNVQNDTQKLYECESEDNIIDISSSSGLFLNLQRNFENNICAFSNQARY